MIIRSRPINKYCWQLILGLEWRPMSAQGRLSGFGCRIGFIKIHTMPLMGRKLESYQYSGFYFNSRLYNPMKLYRMDGKWHFEIGMLGWLGSNPFEAIYKGLVYKFYQIKSHAHKR